MPRLIAATMLAAVVAAGCGGDNKEATDDRPIAAADTSTLEKQLERQINAVMDRLKYDDRSAMWENEFEYLHEEITFDQYLKNGRISYANADSLDRVEVLSAQVYGDSVVAKVKVHFKGFSGSESSVEQDLTLYRQGDRWIKPTASSYAKQLSFDSVRQAAIEAAEREAGN